MEVVALAADEPRDILTAITAHKAEYYVDKGRGEAERAFRSRVGDGGIRFLPQF